MTPKGVRFEKTGNESKWEKKKEKDANDATATLGMKKMAARGSFGGREGRKKKCERMKGIWLQHWKLDERKMKKGTITHDLKLLNED